MACEHMGAPDEAAAFALRQIGRELRDTRLARGEDLRHVAALLRIRPEHLAALESGDIAATPGRTYALGFLRSYAGHLALDRDLLASRLKPALRPVLRPARSAPRPTGRYAVMLAVLLVGAGSVAAYRSVAPVQPSRPGPATAPARGAEELPVVAPPMPQPVDVASAAAAEPATLTVLATRDREDAGLASTSWPDARITLLARADGWIQLRSSDRRFVRSGMLAAGQRIGLPPRSDLLLSAGDGGSVEVLVDGGSLGPAGAPGLALRDLPLPSGTAPPSR